MDKKERLEIIKCEFKKNKKILSALCDENKQKILIVLLENCSTGGIKVNDIAKRVNLSRPAVSHHLKQLLENNIVYIEQNGTKNYYHIIGIDKILNLKFLLENIELYVNERKNEKI